MSTITFSSDKERKSKVLRILLEEVGKESIEISSDFSFIDNISFNIFNVSEVMARIIKFILSVVLVTIVIVPMVVKSQENEDDDKTSFSNEEEDSLEAYQNDIEFDQDSEMDRLKDETASLNNTGETLGRQKKFIGAFVIGTVVGALGFKKVAQAKGAKIIEDVKNKFSTRAPVTRSTRAPVTRSTRAPVTRSTRAPVTRSTRAPVTGGNRDPVTGGNTGSGIGGGNTGSGIGGGNGGPPVTEIYSSNISRAGDGNKSDDNGISSGYSVAIVNREHSAIGIQCKSRAESTGTQILKQNDAMVFSVGKVYRDAFIPWTCKVLFGKTRKVFSAFAGKAPTWKTILYNLQDNKIYMTDDLDSEKGTIVDA